ncbi:MAG TPA: hypothetical protein DCS17_06405 [Flavobacterium sp.]|nr:hypothetical protein [Flavobacterium sp.]
METKIVEIKIDLDDSLKSLLKLKLATVNYEDLQSMYILLYDELKKRDASIGFTSSPTVNYPKNHNKTFDERLKEMEEKQIKKHNEK